MRKIATCDGTNDKGFLFECPGCEQYHRIRVEGPEPRWQFNGSVESPTFNPSILVRGTHYDHDTKQSAPFVCHSFVRDGKIQFLNDCTHSLAGQTVPMLDEKDE